MEKTTDNTPNTSSSATPTATGRTKRVSFLLLDQTLIVPAKVAEAGLAPDKFSVKGRNAMVPLAHWAALIAFVNLLGVTIVIE